MTSPNALRPVAAEVAAEVKGGEQGRNIERSDVPRAAFADGREHQSDDALGDRGVAVGEEAELAVDLLWIDPHGGGAAADLGRVGLERLGHRVQPAPEVDQVSDAVIAFEEGIVFVDIGEFGEGHAGAVAAGARGVTCAQPNKPAAGRGVVIVPRRPRWPQACGSVP